MVQRMDRNCIFQWIKSSTIISCVLGLVLNGQSFFQSTFFRSYPSLILYRDGCRFYVEQPSVVILGKPSAKVADNLEKAEKARIAKQIETLGPEGLKEAERKLIAAKEENNKPIPPEILTSFPIPDVKSISWIPVQTVQEPGIGRAFNPHTQAVSTNGELQKHIESDGEPLPFFVGYDHVEASTLSFPSIPFINPSQSDLDRKSVV